MAIEVLRVVQISSEHFGNVSTLVGMLLEDNYRCWLVPADADREMSSIRSGVRLLLPGLAMEAEEWSYARVTNGAPGISIEEVEITGQLVSAGKDDCLAQLVDVESLVFRAAGHERVVNLETITHVSDFVMRGVESRDAEAREQLLKTHRERRSRC